MPNMTRTLYVRVPAGMKARIDSEARGRLLETSDIVREALMRYLARVDAERAKSEESKEVAA